MLKLDECYEFVELGRGLADELHVEENDSFDVWMSGDKLEQLGSRIGLVESIPKGALSVWECFGYCTFRELKAGLRRTRLGLALTISLVAR